MASVSSFATRRAFLLLTVDEYDKIITPIVTRYLRILYFVFGMLAALIAIAAYVHFHVADVIKSILVASQVGLASFMVLMVAFKFSPAFRCVSASATEAAFRQFSQERQGSGP